LASDLTIRGVHRSQNHHKLVMRIGVFVWSINLAEVFSRCVVQFSLLMQLVFIAFSSGWCMEAHASF